MSNKINKISFAGLPAGFCYRILRSAVFFILTVFILLPLQSVFAQAPKGPETSYEIKLIAPTYAGLLSQVGNGVTLRFKNEPAAIFKNIYTFNSAYPLSFLANYLKGSFVYLQPDQKMETAGVTATDPGFTTDATDIDKQWGLIKAGFNVAWEKTTGSKNNVVAIIDTGIDETHEDLKDVNYLPGFNLVANQPIPVGSDSDDNGHGTLIAGVLAAAPNNGLGITGADWQVSLMPVKALDSSGQGDAASIAEAITWATDHGAEFINLSVGGVGFGYDTTLANAISYAFNKNVFIAAAAGNDQSSMGEDLDQNPVFPVCDDNNYNMVVGVAATDQNDLKPDFSNYGKNCIDVDAPGKRILSTINYDPFTKKYSPNSYAYASGTSLAVPFVIAQAALIKALYPLATNIQIRDRIISTADPIDDLNLSQCGGGSCRGLLGAGRINVPSSLQAAIAEDFTEGQLVKVQDQNGAIYQIVGGQKRLVSPFVYNQKFAGASVQTAFASQLASFPEGSYITPTDGTLVKLNSSPAVYIMQDGKKLPVSWEVFKQMGFSFSSVNTLSFSELNSWVTGNFLPPPDGSLLKGSSGKTVYWVVGQTLHAVNSNFFTDRGLKVFPIITVPQSDIASFPRGNDYIS